MNSVKKEYDDGDDSSNDDNDAGKDDKKCHSQSICFALGLH